MDSPPETTKKKKQKTRRWAVGAELNTAVLQPCKLLLITNKHFENNGGDTKLEMSISYNNI